MPSSLQPAPGGFLAFLPLQADNYHVTILNQSSFAPVFPYFSKGNRVRKKKVIITPWSQLCADLSCETQQMVDIGLVGLHNRDRDGKAKNMVDPGEKIPHFMWNGGKEHEEIQRSSLSFCQACRELS